MHDSVRVKLAIDERTETDGTLARTYLVREDGSLAVELEGAAPESHLLPEGVLDAVMTRFGKPLEPTEKLTEVASLDLGDGGRLRHVRHLARYDVIALDYLVLERPGEEPLVAIATTVAGALVHLGRAASRRS